tara:strand:- start:61 stop:747 length:687 start_codon:yes stop_codon:yes gene_type:complete
MKDFFIFIQARLRSSRLPGKILMNIYNETVLERVIRVTKKVMRQENIFLLTGDQSDPSILNNICKKYGINFFSGDEKNVLKRFCDNIKKNKIKNSNIVRITADNYLIQPSILKKQIDFFRKKKLQYLHIKPLSHFGGEIVSSDLLLNQIKNKPSKNCKEHVTWNIRKKLKIKKYALNHKFGGINHKKRITLDTIFDLEFLKKIEKRYLGLNNLDCINEIKKIKAPLYK